MNRKSTGIFITIGWICLLLTVWAYSFYSVMHTEYTDILNIFYLVIVIVFVCIISYLIIQIFMVPSIRMIFRKNKI